MDGKLVIFSAPSGAGKTTIVKHLLNKGYNLEFSISACNRPARGAEKHGKDYYFLTTDDFKEKIENNQFIEWEEVYAGRFYGTLRSEVDRIWEKGNHVLFDVDVKGGINIKKQFGDKALSVFVMPPSVQELENRLQNRCTDTEEDIKNRIAKAEEEITYAKNFDKVILNDNLEKAQAQAEEILDGFLRKKS